MRTALLALLLTASQATAQTGATITVPTDLTKEIEAKLGAGDITGAITAARGFVAQVWEATPTIGFTQSTLVAQNATGYGIYNPRTNNQFKQATPILIYCEPVGFGYGAPGAGLYSVNFFVDLQILDASGTEIAANPAATEYNQSSRQQNKEVPVNITYNIDGLQPGRYTLITTLRDKNSPKSGSFQTAIEILP